MSDNNQYSGMNFDPMTGERLRPAEGENQANAGEAADLAHEFRTIINDATAKMQENQTSEQMQGTPISEQMQGAQTRTDMASEQAQGTQAEAGRQPYFDHVGESMARDTKDPWAEFYAQEDAKQAKKQERKAKKLEKKAHRANRGGFLKRALAAAILAVIFGGVAGGTFYGFCYFTGVWEKNASTTPVAIEAQEQKQPITDISQSAGSQEIRMANSDNIQLVTTDMSDMVQEVVPAMVTILNTGEKEYDFWGRSYTPQSGGTGVIIGENDSELLIVTNHHVAEDAQQIDVTFVDDTTVQAHIKGMDADMDLAVLAVSLKDISEETKSKIAIAKIGDSDNLKLGQPAVVIGNALGYGISVTDGVISALNREMTTEDGNTGTFIQTDAAINHGNSGGALVNIKGELIGIVSSKLQGTSVEGMGYAIPISAASPIIKELMEYQTRTEVIAEAEQGYLGVQLQTVTDEASQFYGMPSGGFVYNVIEESGAEKAGLKKGDVITKIEKQKVSSNADARKILQYYKQGEEVTVSFERMENGEYVKHEVKVVLGAASAK